MVEGGDQMPSNFKTQCVVDEQKNKCPVISEVKRGSGIKFNRIRRITGY